MEKLVKGIVIREAEYKESDKILTVLTDEGKLTVTARGAKKPTGKNLSVSSLFVYSELTLKEQNGKYYLSGGSVIESFYTLREDFERLSLASAMIEIAAYLSENKEDAAFILKLTLNCLFFLCKPEVNIDLVKSVFEAKCSEYSGFFPEFDGCDFCGNITEKMYFDAESCELCCKECVKNPETLLSINQNVLKALNYIGENGLLKALKFNMNEKDMRMLSSVTEAILCAQLGRRFESLNYFKKMRI